MERVVDIIIPTYKRPRILLERLSSYWSQPEARKIIVIDSGDSHETEEMIADIKEHSPIPIIYHRFPERRMQQAGKNYGFEVSDSPYIFIGEDDLALGNGHLGILLDEMKSSGADIIGGRRVYINDGQSFKDALADAPSSRKIFFRYPFEAYFEAYFEGCFEVPYMHSNVLIKKKVANSVRFDERYKGNAFREELDFFLSCRRNGFSIFATGRTACFHLKSPRKKGTGSQIKRLIYEYFVWVNTWKCFSKNADVLEKYFGFRFPRIAVIGIIIGRYANAFIRRIWRKY